VPTLTLFQPDAAPQAPAGASPLRLGARVKALRLARAWTLEETSARTGLSRSALSKIEREEASPGFQAIQHLAQGFGLDLVEFLTATPGAAVSGRRSITRAGEGARYDTPNYALRLLVNDLTRPAFVASEIRITARALSDYPDWDRHDHEDLLYVLEGELTLLTEHYQPVTLQVGDSVYFDARMGHACLSAGPGAARALWISSPVQPKEP